MMVQCDAPVAALNVRGSAEPEQGSKQASNEHEEDEVDVAGRVCSTNGWGRRGDDLTFNYAAAYSLQRRAPFFRGWRSSFLPIAGESDQGGLAS